MAEIRFQIDGGCRGSSPNAAGGCRSRQSRSSRPPSATQRPTRPSRRSAPTLKRASVRMTQVSRSRTNCRTSAPCSSHPASRRPRAPGPMISELPAAACLEDRKPVRRQQIARLWRWSRRYKAADVPPARSSPALFRRESQRPLLHDFDRFPVGNGPIFRSATSICPKISQGKSLEINRFLFA